MDGNPHPQTTLRQILTQPKPEVRCEVPKCRGATASPDWPKVTVSKWTAFTVNNLNASYGHILDLSVSPGELGGRLQDCCPKAQQALAGGVIETPAQLQLLTDWNETLLQPTLEYSKAQLNLSGGLALYHSRPAAVRSRQRPGVGADHAVELGPSPNPYLMVGLVKPSALWNHQMLSAELTNPNQHTTALRQLAGACEKAGTRYGYIQTEKDVTVCRFTRRSSLQGWKASVTLIPWSNYGQHLLTTELALWWLCMLAMSPRRNRTLAAEDDFVEIDKWETPGYLKFRHCYSNLELSSIRFTTKFPGWDPLAGCQVPSGDGSGIAGFDRVAERPAYFPTLGTNGQLAGGLFTEHHANKGFGNFHDAMDFDFGVGDLNSGHLQNSHVSGLSPIQEGVANNLSGLFPIQEGVANNLSGLFPIQEGLGKTEGKEQEEEYMVKMDENEHEVSMALDGFR